MGGGTRLTPAKAALKEGPSVRVDDELMVWGAGEIVSVDILSL